LGRIVSISIDEPVFVTRISVSLRTSASDARLTVLIARTLRC
jgi:hypothetical protein